ncbi:hypothetical protein C0Q58_21245 [Streptomyces albidoflavus]|uniref:hypothetical protein n=1 Tax=Streptomyces TaxID=1883 RepID=UPI0010E46FA5|nr:hypothetical protein [Streptomyces albidoflavus]MCM3818755.1 hypothetical protein [Streptomyces sp. DR3-1]RZD59758.1 hypothetical protein C0Q58_21245 [Streptomyces albidoflavus]
MIQRGNGHTGEAHGFAANLAKAKRILWPAAQEPPTPHRCRRRTPFAPTPDGTAPHQRRAPAEASPERSPERCRRDPPGHRRHGPERRRRRRCHPPRSPRTRRSPRPRPGEASADRPLALRPALCRKGQESAAPSTDPAR